MPWLQNLRQRARELNREIAALFLAARHPRTPWYAKLLMLLIVAYAVSPIDLIPDFIPVLGYLDDLVLLPLGILAVRRLIPPEVLAECRQRASELQSRPKNWMAAAVIVVIWLAVTALAIAWLLR